MDTTKPQPADHAIVLGAGIGGLTAGRVLADHYAQVTVIERDPLPASPRARRGVPQGCHMHGLVAHGADLPEGLLPRLRADLVDAGAAEAQLLSDFRVSYFGSVLRQVPIDLNLVLSSRPFLEDRLRHRVAALPNIKITDATEAVRLTHTQRDEQITGVMLASADVAGAPQRVEADFVVDATGRAGRSATWLSELGYPRPAETKVHVDVAYASRHYRMRPDALPADKVTVVGPQPHRPQGMSLVAQKTVSGCCLSTDTGKRITRPPGRRDSMPSPGGYLRRMPGARCRRRTGRRHQRIQVSRDRATSLPQEPSSPRRPRRPR